MHFLPVSFSLLALHQTTHPPRLGMAATSPSLPLAKLPAPREQKFRWKAKRTLALVTLTFHSGTATYLSWGDKDSVGLLAVSYAALVLIVFVSHIGGGCQEGGLRWMKATIWSLTSLLAALLGYKLVRRIAPPPTSVLLVAVAGSTALGVGGCLSFLIHRHSWFKHPSLEVTVPLTRELP